jgi:CheY-like chemotaxis protein
MSTNLPAEESPSQSASDISQSDRRLDPVDESAVTSASVRDRATDLQGHLLAAMFRSMAAQVDTLADGDLNARDGERLASLHQDTLWVGEILNAWQAAARLATGEGSPNLLPIDFQRFAREQTEAASGPAAIKGISLQFSAQSVSEVMGEPGLIKRLVEAILSVALFISRHNSRLAVAVAEAEGFVTYRVGTTGEEVASQSDGSQVLDHARLADIVDALRPLAEAQSGTLVFDSQPGEAFELRFSLPTARTSDTPAQGAVLIVDDDPDGAFLLEQVLLKAGFRVRIAGNGLEGLSLARQEGIAVILLDVMLPGLDGFEVCHRLREDPATAKKPIVMISAKARAEDREMGLRVGANAYMTKPLGMSDVVQTVTRYMTTTEEGSHDR